MIQAVFFSKGRAGLLLGAILIGTGLLPVAQGQPGQLEEITSFANGQKFYLDKGSFVPVGNGRLQYRVVGESNSGAKDNQVSMNEIDCGTGRLRSPVNSGATGINTPNPAPDTPITVSNRTRLHSLLKDACSANLPELQGNW